ncbi:unnamed protein product [Linum tenue]|uniref:F-box domain-containing protein n=1 Tax=Linum tenue TaxID=586396 RepID=A0AAV0NP72_9ROSI|nr:unnamed protein product [Linum tenue]
MLRHHSSHPKRIHKTHHRRHRMEQRESPTVAGSHDEERDRISELPDEILHDILSRVKSQKFIGKATVLSKRWANLCFSYPTLEFNRNDFRSKETLKSFMAAAAKRLSSSQHQNNTNSDLFAVKIKFDISGWLGNHNSDFCTSILDDLLGSIAENPPQKIYVTASHYSIPREFLLPAGGGQLCRIKHLSLENCNFDRYVDLFPDDKNRSNPFDCLRGSLRKLSLMSVNFPDGGRILNSMVAGASLLEELTVMFFRGVKRVQVRDLPNLKILKLYTRDKVDFDIAWPHCPSKDGAMAIVLTPDLASVEIASARACASAKWDVEDLMWDSPLLESSKPSTRDFSKVYDLKIVNNDELKEVKLNSWNYSISLSDISFLLWVNLHFFPTILSKDDKSFALVTIHIALSRHLLNGLGKLLAKLSQFWLSVQLIHEFPNGWEEDVDQCGDVQSPIIEHVIVSQRSLSSCNKKEFFLDTIFYCCRPKFLSFTPRIYKLSRENMLSVGEVSKRWNRLLKCNTFLYIFALGTFSLNEYIPFRSIDDFLFLGFYSLYNSSS